MTRFQIAAVRQPMEVIKVLYCKQRAHTFGIPGQRPKSYCKSERYCKTVAVKAQLLCHCKNGIVSNVVVRKLLYVMLAYCKKAIV